MPAPVHISHHSPVTGNPHSRRAFHPLAWIARIPMGFTLTITLVPVVSWFVMRLDDGSDEPLGLLVLALAAALAWRDRKSLHASKSSSIIGALAILISVLGIGILPPMIRAFIAITGLCACFGIHRKPGLMGLAVLSLPVITSLQFYAGYPMRLAAAEGSVRLLELGGGVVSRNGVDIIIGGIEVSVDPACSGIRMAWHALAAAMAMAAIHRVSWRNTLLGGALAGLLIVPANILRSTWLALEECGKLQSTGLSHEGAGLLCFAVILIPLWLWISKQARPAQITAPGSSGHATSRVILFTAALLTPVCMLRSQTPDTAPPLDGPPSTFTFNGLTFPLSPLPSSDTELAFAKSFPGSISNHSWGGHQVILRRVTRATRRLHPSRDCLRAAGFETTHSKTIHHSSGERWSRFHATRNGSRLIVHERIISERDGSTWTDASSWYWSALRHPLNGPWRAETLITRE